jgi:hypothetical protein
VTSNRSVGERGEVFADPVVATAILDRLLHHRHVITIRGESYRLREKRRAGQAARPRCSSFVGRRVRNPALSFKETGEGAGIQHPHQSDSRALSAESVARSASSDGKSAQLPGSARTVAGQSSASFSRITVATHLLRDRFMAFALAAIFRSVSSSR